MFRTPLLTVSLLLTACGIESPEPALQEEAPLVAQQPAPTNERMEIRELTPQVRPSQIAPLGGLIGVHSLDVPDGTQVRYVLGMLGCGISVVGRGTATVHGGAFDIAFEPDPAPFGGLSLFIQFDPAGTCDPETSTVYEVGVSESGTVDLSVLPENTFGGCWVFDL
ncbi:MAG: hypothetical protein Q8K32_07965 [Archangium sp.]|nr:hypothetical protein [Archangium sp.]